MPKPTISPARDFAFNVLHDVLTHGRLLDESLETFEPAAIQHNDRALAREIISGTCRHFGKITFTLKQFAKNYEKLPPKIQRILELSAYQILYLDRVPSHAVVSDAVNLAKANQAAGLSNAVNGILRNLIREKHTINYPQRDENILRYLAIEHSHPEWIIKEWQRIWGNQDTEKLCRFNNTQAPLSLRVRGSMDEAKQLLAGEKIEYSLHPVLQNMITLDNSLPTHALLQNKMWVVQDPVMTIPAAVLNPKPGWKIWDVCAAPGGKTFHLADLMSNEGTIIASDKSAKRLEKLKNLQEFLTLDCIHPLVCNPLQDTLPPEFSNFDAILLDVPCTGWGTFRRNPDLRWRLQPQDSEHLGETAYQLLNHVFMKLKPGGCIVYSTCTLSPKENELIIERFLHEHESFQLDDIRTSIPSPWHSRVHPKGWFTAFPPSTQTDGAFCARLQHTET